MVITFNVILFPCLFNLGKIQVKKFTSQSSTKNLVTFKKPLSLCSEIFSSLCHEFSTIRSCYVRSR